MQNQPIRFTKEIVFSFLNYDVEVDASDLAECSSRLPAIQFLPQSVTRRALRTQGIRLDTLPEVGSEFTYYSGIEGMNLLFYVFSDGKKNYLRSINFLSRDVTTVVLDVTQLSCEDLFRSQRLLAVQSHPPFSDVLIDQRQIGEAPLWVWLRPGSYQVKCSMRGHYFDAETVYVPKDVYHLCQRQNVEPKHDVRDDDGLSSDEKGGAVLIYLMGIAATAAAIALPILLFF